MNYIINNLNIVTSDGVIENGFIEIHNNVIKTVGTDSSKINEEIPVYDGNNLKVFPGFIDCHTHGGYGVDFESCDENSLSELCSNLYKEGVTSFIFASVTNSKDKIIKQLQTVGGYIKNQLKLRFQKKSRCIGIHLEGPFISKAKKGAHEPMYIIKPDIDLLNEFIYYSHDNIKLITYDIENDIDNEFGKFLESKKIIGSIGHSNLLYNQYEEYNSITPIVHVTHLFNAMSGLENRKAGLALFSLMNDDTLCEIIVDNHHVEKQLVQFAYNLKGYEKICLITDSMSAKGREDGIYKLGELTVEKKGEICVVKDTETLAGSVAEFNLCFKNMKQITDANDVEMLYMSSKNIAKQLKVDHIIGDIKTNMLADLVFLDDNYDIKMTMIDGIIVYKE